ncbi:MAG: FAD:protein FMN transferase [Planctomycetes bacterium]|nr:FAD:protein FMN transferase [Planctomycetota bacterium]
MKRFIVLAVLLAGCEKPAAPPPVPKPSSGPVTASWKGKVMGSSSAIQVWGDDQAACDAAVADALAEIQRLETMMTDWKQDSPLMDINHAAGQHPVKVPPELLFLITRSQQISELTGGGFDISFAGAGKLWRWRDPDPKIPTDEEVKASLVNVGYKGIVVDQQASTVYLTKPGMRIGLDAIAPGYAADRAIEKIRARGIKTAIVDMSGDLMIIGEKDALRPVSIQHPRKKDEMIAVLPVVNCGVSTSGDYERFFMKDGKRYCHIIDPLTGYPADKCQSVTIIAPVLGFADGLATGVFVMGPEKGMELVEKLEGVEAIIVAADGTVSVSSGLKGAKVNGGK